MTTRTHLLWIERTLLGIGVALALWCGATWLEARFFQGMPVPPAQSDTAPQRSQEAALPGDPGSSGPAPSPDLPAGTWIARLDAPSVHLSATVLEGSDDATLSRGAGHIEDTAFPGQDGNVGIAGHRDTTFRPVRNLKLGDVLKLTTKDRVFEYRITGTKIVEPEDVYVLDPTPKPAMTLVTCYPFEYIGHAPHRYIIRAELVETTKRSTH